MQAQVDARTPVSTAPSRRWVYVGSRTESPARGAGIGIYRMDTATGEWMPAGVVSGLVNPMFLALDNTHRYLYSIHGKYTGISAFRIDLQTGGLTRLAHQRTGNNPVHLAVDPTSRYVVVANLGTGPAAKAAIE